MVAASREQLKQLIGGVQRAVSTQYEIIIGRAITVVMDEYYDGSPLNSTYYREGPVYRRYTEHTPRV